MTKRGVALAVSAIVLTAALSACSKTPPVSKNLRLDLYLSVAGETRVFSTVQGLRIAQLGGNSSGVFRQFDYDVSGSALAVRVAEGLPLLVMLMDQQGSDAGYHGAIMNCVTQERGGDDGPLVALEAFQGPCRIAQGDLPSVIAMHDPGHPFDVEAYFLARLSDWYGVPVRFEALTLTATSDPVDLSIVEVMPWVQKGQRPERDIYAPYHGDPSNGLRLNYRAFIGGIDG